ncbi:hypothetical protein Ssi03_51970 [Sphaerisporangium siamense]|uniref:General stress protein 17M-like domain-containing protein n=1 Tax=Sphaerisporangium siamense TaxID=795645 RepID=A0A7W7GAT2_9ACTN|nr:general stress protein [Sphaerisporangium siamense]MBB4702100.1 hypothetical protein [Sphaerisporangium siamense]GII87207.1 hypothetical protein Ssi03_51970 [Sphaerisporangium siamense]
MIQTSPAPTSSVAVDRRLLVSYDNYPAAQRAVDTLSDAGYPVQNVAIVGSDLRLEETVTGRLTNPRAALSGAISGAVFGLVVGMFLGLFTSTTASFFALAIWAALWGAVMGAGFGFAGHAFKGGTRDFSSRSMIVAGRYDVLVPSAALQEAVTVLEGGLRPADTVVVARPPSSGPYATATAPTAPQSTPTPPPSDHSPTPSGSAPPTPAPPPPTGPSGDTPLVRGEDDSFRTAHESSSPASPVSPAAQGSSPSGTAAAGPSGGPDTASSNRPGTSGEPILPPPADKAEAMEEATIALPLSTVRAATTSADSGPATTPPADPDAGAAAPPPEDRRVHTSSAPATPAAPGFSAASEGPEAASAAPEPTPDTSPGHARPGDAPQPRPKP